MRLVARAREVAKKVAPKSSEPLGKALLWHAVRGSRWRYGR